MLPTDYYFVGNTASHNDKKILSEGRKLILGEKS